MLLSKTARHRKFLKPMANLASVACTALLAGCLSMSPAAMRKLAAYDPLEANPADLRIALDAPKRLSVRDSDIVLTISHSGGEGFPAWEEKFAAKVDSVTTVAPGIDPVDAGSRQLIIAAITPEEQPRVLAAQARARQARAQGLKGKGNIAVGATGCRNGPLDEDRLPISLYLQTGPAEPFMPIMRDVDLIAILKDKGGANGIPLCDILPLAAD